MYFEGQPAGPQPLAQQEVGEASPPRQLAGLHASQIGACSRCPRADRLDHAFLFLQGTPLRTDRCVSQFRILDFTHVPRILDRATTHAGS